MAESGGCKKKRRAGNLALNKLRTEANKRRRVASHDRRQAKHRSHVVAWARRNRFDNPSADTRVLRRVVRGLRGVIDGAC